MYELEANVTELEITIKKLQSRVNSLQSDISSPVDSTLSDVVEVAAPMPTSCRDLRRLGHAVNGFYSVLASTMIETIFCDFAKLPDDSGTIRFAFF